MAGIYDPYDPEVPFDAPSSGEVSWGDRARAVGTGAATLASDLASGVRAIGDATDSPSVSALADFFRTTANVAGNRLNRGMSEDAKSQLESSVMSKEFWDHPVSAGFLKALNMTPMIAAAVVPAFFAAPGLAATAAVAGAGGAMGAGMSASDTYTQTDDMSDDEFRHIMPYYDGLRRLGLDEDEARAEANRKLMGLKPLWNAVANAAGMVLGPAGHMVGMAPKVAAGILKRTGARAAEGAIGGVMMGGTADYTHQQTEIELDKRTQIDAAQLMTATAEGMLLQGAMGAVGGAVTRGRNPNVVDARAPDAAQTLALTDKAPPANPRGWETNPNAEGPVVGGAAEPVTPRVTSEPPVPVDPRTPTEHAIDAQPSLEGEALAREFPKVPVEDAGQTVPEAPATLEAQRDQLVAGQRKAMLLPKSDTQTMKQRMAIETPPGMKRTVTKDGTFIYNPKLIKPKEIYDASKAGRLNEILALGEFSKTDVAARVAAGEQPLAVTERAPDGTEVKAAAGTDGTAPSQVASLEAAKTPGNAVQIEPAQRVLQDRVAAAQELAPQIRQKAAPKSASEPAPVVEAPVEPAAPRDLPAEKLAEIERKVEALAKAAEQQEAAGRPMQGGIAAFMERKRDQLIGEAKAELGLEAAPKEAAPARAAARVLNKGKNWGSELDRRVENGERAQAVVDQFKPNEAEAGYRAKTMAGVEARRAILERARAMVEAAEKAGVKIPKRIKDIINKEAEHPPQTILLTEAKTLIAPRKKGTATEDFDRFLTREAILRSGAKEDRALVVSDRRAEGDQKMTARSKGKGVEETADPEAATRAERERLEEIPDERESISEEAVDADGPTQEGGQERARVALKGDEVLAGKDKAGTFKVETRKRPTVRRIGDDSPYEIDEREFYMRLENIKPIERRSFGGYLNEKGGELRGVSAALIPYIAKRLRALVGDIQVHIISEKDMNALNEGAQGLYITSAMDGKAKIYVLKSVADNPAMMRHVIMHEGMHAAVEHVLESDPRARHTVDMMRQEVNAHLEKIFGSADPAEFQHAFVNSKYALTDPHEFMSEAMSNPQFQEVLSNIDASPELVKRLQLDSPLSLRDTIVQFIRRTLGIENSKANFRLIEAALRTSNQLMMQVNARDLAVPRPRFSMRAAKVGDFSPEAAAAHMEEINSMFREPLNEALGHTASKAKSGAANLIEKVTSPGKMAADALTGAKAAGSVMGRILNKVTTNLQYAGKVAKDLPMARDIADMLERIGTKALHLKEEGIDLASAMLRAEKQNPEAYAKFADLLHEQTMLGVDASAELGAGRNGHLTLSKELMEKLAKGQKLDDVAHEAAMKTWAAREAHPAMKARYDAIVKAHPDFARLQKKLFDFYERTQGEMMRDQIDNIMKQYEFKGTDVERRAAAKQFYSGKLTQEFRADLVAKMGESAVKQLEATEALRVVNGPYAPLMRRGEHAVVGTYKVEPPKNGVKIDEDTYEFKTRKEAHDFAVKTGLHADPKIVYYDTATGKPVAEKADAISTGGQPEQRFQVRLQRQHLEFHESETEARKRHAELEESGLFDELSLEERRRILSDQAQFTNRGVESLLRSLAQTERYKNATDGEREALRTTIRETGLRALSDNRVQSRRLPRRNVQGASDDIARNLYDYNSSQANYRARMAHRAELDAKMEEMHAHVKAERYKGDTDARFRRSQAANEMERRVRSADPNEYTGGYSEWARRISTASYVARMVRPSYLILHQTHLPMISIPWMAGRHGLKAYTATMKAWREFSGLYGAGAKDTMGTMADALHKSTDLDKFFKEATAGAKDAKNLHRMYDEMNELGFISPHAGYEVQKYMPSRQAGGVVGGIDRAMTRVDTVFRQLTNASEALNRFASATAAYRMEAAKLTRAGKSAEQVHAGAVEYVREMLTNTHGVYTSTNAAPLFKNRYLRPFLQFKQFPQMMYHLLGKLASQALKGENKEVQIQAVASLASILGMHAMVVGAASGLPLEPFKILGFISKGLGLTEGDWTTVEQSVLRQAQETMGKDAARLLMRGAASELGGVDVHTRLGLNSLLTFDMPSQPDQASIGNLAFQTAIGAPGALVSDTVKGVSTMLHGDIEGGAFQAVPFQAMRDWRNAVRGDKFRDGTEPTMGERIVQGIGFTPARKGLASQKANATYNATREFSDRRTELMGSWTKAPAGERDAIWQRISEWNSSRAPRERITKGDLYRALTARARAQAGPSPTSRTKLIADSIAELY